MTSPQGPGPPVYAKLKLPAVPRDPLQVVVLQPGARALRHPGSGLSRASSQMHPAPVLAQARLPAQDRLWTGNQGGTQTCGLPRVTWSP